MADRDEFLTELYFGIGQLRANGLPMIPFDDFKTIHQHDTSDEIRKQVLEIRKILNHNV